MSGDLLDPALMRRLEGVALGRRRTGGAVAGAHRATRRGESLEFADHRPYVPGDDIRHLDWSLLGRLDQLFVRLYEARQDRTVHLLVDRSASMTGAKWTAARTAAAAVGWMGLCSLDRVRAVALADAPTVAGDAARGRRGVARLFDFLRAQQPAGGTDLERAVQGVPPGAGSLVVLISDLWTPDLESALARLARFESWVLHVVDPEELDPRHLRGDLTLVDAETGAELPVSVDQPVRAAYAAAAASWLRDTEAAARRRGVGYARLDVGEDLGGALLAFARRAGA